MKHSISKRALCHLLITIVVGLVAVCHPAIAQTPSPPLDEASAGTSYLIAFPDTTTNVLDPRFPNTKVQPEFSIWVYSAVENKVRVTAGSGGTTTFNVPAGRSVSHSLGAPVVTTINAPSSNTYRVESEYPIILYCYMATPQSMEAWAPIPVDRWGMSYNVASAPGEVVHDVKEVKSTGVETVKKMASAEILIIAAHDNTRITLRPSPTDDFLGGPSRTITLNAGQAFQVQSIVDTALAGAGQPDIAATVITSDKPIGVLSGNTRAQIDRSEPGLLNNIYKNMLMEWLTPSDQHGTEFVYMPTWDARRPGAGSNAEREREYVRFYATQQKSLTGHYLQPGGNAEIPFSIRRDTLQEFVFGAPQAVFFKTGTPAQGMMHSSAVVRLLSSTPCADGIPCVTYEGWAPYMAEMIPREQWTTFAPYYVPDNPSAMEHFVNVVADSISAREIYNQGGSKFIFQRKIPGTDLVWGSMQVNPGGHGYLHGRNGARFHAVAYGLLKGSEIFRPGEYEEYSALSYGYPLAPGRNVLRMADSVVIDTVIGCGRLTIRAEAVNQDPAGFRSVTLDPASTVNARLVAIDPANLSDITGRTRIEVLVEAIDPIKNAQATVLLTDRTGKVWRIEYRYEAEFVTLDPSGPLDFGTVLPGSTATKTVTVTNPMSKAVMVKDIRLVNGARGYTIASTVPPVPVKLAPGEKITVTVNFAADAEPGARRDTVKVELECMTAMLPMRAQIGSAIISVSDIDFGSFILGGAPSSRALKICNIGQGALTFNNPNDPTPRALLEWIDTHFTVADPSKVDALKTMTLGPGQCYEEIEVTFTPSAPGTFRTVARVWGSTRSLRDTSVWSAFVEMTSGVDDAASQGYDLTVAGYPDRGENVELRYTLGASSHVRIEIFDALGARAASLLDERKDAGAHAIHWNIASRASGVYYCRIVAGEWSRTVPVMVTR